MDKEKQKTYNRAYINRIRDERRAYAKNLLGGKCVDCGTIESLEFDHENRSTKIAPIAKMWTSKWEKFIEELLKCKLRCRPCHTAKGIRCGDIIEGKHGANKYRRYHCRCYICKSEYNAKRRARYKRKHQDCPTVWT